MSGEDTRITVKEVLQNIRSSLRGLSNLNPHLISHVWPLSANEVESLSKNRPGLKSKHWRELEQLEYPRLCSDRVVQLVRRAVLALPGMAVMESRYELMTRLCVGLGATAWELGLAYLNPYGVPWIPGSSLKGAMRATLSHYLLRRGVSLKELEGIKRGEMGTIPGEVASRFVERGQEVVDAVKRLVDLFGTTKYRGRLIAFGGFATSWRGRSPIHPEVMTPHYRRYYSDEGGRTYPSETESPNPIHFPVVREGTAFTFVLAAPAERAREVDSLLEETLVERGIGAKKSSGFGIFRRVK